MNFGWIYTRDAIFIDEDFKKKIDETLKIYNVPLGSTILLAARDFKVRDGYTFHLVDYDLMILSNRLDGGTNGTIALTGRRNLPGQKLTVACKQLIAIDLRSEGGPGLQGHVGMRGRPGRPGRSRPRGHGGNGGPGGDGGAGGPGGPGATGGNVRLVFIEDKVPGGFDQARSIDVPGGAGGPGGLGGPGGPGGLGGDGDPPGEDGPDGSDGADGSDGESGPPGTKEAKQVSETDYYKEIQPFAEDWSAYRLRLGEYYFRAFNPSGPPVNEYLELAMREFTEILALDPQNERAMTYRNNILSNENILGLPRNIDIIPDFEHYQGIVRDYGPIVLSLFSTATNLLTTGVPMDQKRLELDREIAHLQGLTDVLRAEVSEAQLAIAVVQTEERLLNDRLAAIRRRIGEKEEEMRNRFLDIGGVLLTLGRIAVGIFGIYTGGSAIIAVVPALIKLKEYVQDKDVVQIIKSKESRDEFKKQAGGLVEAVHGIEGGIDALISLPKMFDQLRNGIPASSPDAEYGSLLREATELTHQKKLAQMRKTQAEVALVIVRKKLALAENDVTLARQQRAGLIEDIEYLKQIAVNLIRSAQRYMDILIKYGFLAARALEIYTYEDMSNNIRYDYGYIHPDHEEDLLLKPTTVNNRSSFLPLIDEYVNSWKQFVNILVYQDRYEKYISSGDQVHDIQFLSFTDQNILLQFKQSADLFFAVELKELPQSRFEAKVEFVHLYLENVTSNSPAVTLIVEHSGRYNSKLRNGEVIETVLRPRRATALSGSVPPNFEGSASGNSPIDLSFWGRGVSTPWHIYIEKDEIATKQIDLSQLSKIEVSIGYRSFLVPS